MICKKICSGDLKYAIEIYNRTLNPDNCDADISTLLKHSVRAAIKVRDLVNGNIFAKNDINIHEIATHTFTIRYQNDIVSDDIIKYDDKYFRIISYIDPDERKRWLTIHAVERGIATEPRNIL